MSTAPIQGMFDSQQVDHRLSDLQFRRALGLDPSLVEEQAAEQEEQ